MLNAKMIIAELQKIMPQLKYFGIEDIGIFGSYFTGTANLNSDIDVLVTFKSGKKNFDNYMDLKFYLEDHFRTKIDLVIETSIRPGLKDYILENLIYAT